VLDGLFFDTDKAVLTPESRPALDVIAQFLEDDPSLQVFIVGHTDTDGTLEHNMTLSLDRAKAVVAALTTHYGISVARLSAHGVGPLSPAKTNRSDAGKSANRRVEMVAR
jgi:outer membrane protein OmpA-like peptidoglycan-associated protein